MEQVSSVIPVLVHPFVGFSRIATETAVVWTTRDQNLRRDVDVRPRGLAGNLDPVRQGRGDGMSPAGAAILRQMLIPCLNVNVW